MRAPRRHRPSKRVFAAPPEGCDVESAAVRAHYIGSPEHKDCPSFAGHPKPRADATICDRSFVGRLDEINKWLKSAIRLGHTGEWSGPFPRYAWHREGGSVFEARLVNEGNGEYKGYELNGDEWPPGL